MRHLLSIALGLALFAAEAHAEVRVPGIFGDHMVLQRGLPVRVWGTADPGEEVTVRIAGKRAGTVADDEGAWRVESLR